MNKKNFFFAVVAVALCAICTSCNNGADYYLKWTPGILFGDAKVQTNMIDSVCRVEAAANNYALDSERIIKLNTTDKNDAREKMKAFGAAVEKRMIETGRFTAPALDENGDYKDQTGYIHYETCIQKNQGTDKVKTVTSDVLKYGFIFQ